MTTTGGEMLNEQSLKSSKTKILHSTKKTTAITGITNSVTDKNIL